MGTKCRQDRCERTARACRPWLEELEPRCLLSTIYVATAGSDTSGNGTIGNPFATISHAAEQAHPGDTVVIRQGTYRETVGGLDPVTKQSVLPNDVTIKAYPGESVTVSGTDLVTTPWVQRSPGSPIYQTTGVSILTPVPSGAPFGPEMDQVFVDGQSMTEARWPNTPLGLTFTKPCYATAAAANAGAPTNIVPVSPPLPSPWVTCDETIQLDPTFQVPAGASGDIIQIVMGPHWFWQTGTVNSVTTASNSLNFHFTETFTTLRGMEVPINAQVNANGLFGGTPTASYLFLEGADELDSAGEWWLTAGAGTNPQVGTLSLWTPQGDSPANHVVEHKVRPFAFDFSGTQGITLQGVNIFAAGINTDANTTGLTLEGLNAQYVYQDTTVINPYSDNVDNSGIILNGSDNVLENSVIRYSSANGVTLLGTGNSVLNCVVSDTDYAGNNASTINTGTGADGPTRGATIANNTTSDTWREGIEVHNLEGGSVVYNTVSFAGLQTYDQGLIHTVGNAGTPAGTNAQTTIAYNVVHDDTGHNGKGIYLDEGSSGYNVHHNVTWNVDFGMALNGNGQLNSIYNNTFVAGVPFGGTNLVHFDGTQTNDLISNNIFQTGADLTPFTTAGNVIADNFQSNPTATTPNPAGFVDPAANNYQVTSGSAVLGPGYNGTFTSAAGFTSSPYAGAFGPVSPPPPPPPTPGPTLTPTSGPTPAGTGGFPESVRSQLLVDLALLPEFDTPQARATLRGALRSLVRLALVQSPQDTFALVVGEAAVLVDVALGRTADAAVAARSLDANPLYHMPLGYGLATIEAELFFVALVRASQSLPPLAGFGARL
jgi:hypothetical protein